MMIVCRKLMRITKGKKDERRCYDHQLAVLLAAVSFNKRAGHSMTNGILFCWNLNR